MIAEFHGVEIDFGDLPQSEVQVILAGEQDKIDQRGIDKWLKPLMDKIPEQIDYTAGLDAVGELLMGIKELVGRDGKDYSAEFDKILAAVGGIKLEQRDIDLSPLIAAVKSIPKPEATQLDLSSVTAILTKLLNKKQNVTVEAEKRPVPKGFEIVERDALGNAKMIEVRY